MQDSAVSQAFTLLFSGDKALWEIVWISLNVSFWAILFAAPIGLVIAFFIGQYQFPGRSIVSIIVNTSLAIPTVLVGLVLYMLLSNSGPLGDWRLLFTQRGMIIGQFLIALPVVTAYCAAALNAPNREAYNTARTLGATPFRAFRQTIHDVRGLVLAATVTAFGRILSEVGCSIMIGGNILHYTRNIPTAIALETSKGAFAEGIALGMVLLAIALLLNSWAFISQGKPLTEL